MRTLWLVVVLSSLAATAKDDRRFRVGVGLRTHGGAMFQRGATFLLLQSQLFAAGEVRVGERHALRLQLGFVAGWPDAFAGETNVSFRFGLGARVTLGAGVFAYWGVPSLKGGLEVPLALRFGEQRTHELGLAVRATAGAFNNVTFVWWDFPNQYAAFSVEGSLGYTFFF